MSYPLFSTRNPSGYSGPSNFQYCIPLHGGVRRRSVSGECLCLAGYQHGVQTLSHVDLCCSTFAVTSTATYASDSDSDFTKGHLNRPMKTNYCFCSFQIKCPAKYKIIVLFQLNIVRKTFNKYNTQLSGWENMQKLKTKDFSLHN